MPYQQLLQRLSSRVLGRTNDCPDLATLDLVLTTIFADGHLLLEDYPGSGKTFLAKELMESIAFEPEPNAPVTQLFHRVQCTPDLLPGDVTGGMVLDDRHQFVMRKGPIFACLVLVDEINRTTPKVQSAFLEAMAERQVTVDDRTYPLGEFFLVIATQNPLDRAGTFELPAAQLDRFLFKRRLGPVSEEAQRNIVSMGDPFYEDSSQAQKPVPDPVPISEILRARRDVWEIVRPHPHLRDGLVEIANALDARSELREGSRPSPRSLQFLYRAAKVIAWRREGDLRAVATPQDVLPLACDFFRHRIYPREALTTAELDSLIKETVTPVIEGFTLR